MSYNPTLRSRSRKRPRPNPDPHSGTKHSDIMKRRGVGTSAPVSSARDNVKTKHGYRSPVFNCDSFSQYFECMFAGNATGFGVNTKGDRAIRVMRGNVYLTTGKVVDGKIVDGRDTTLIQEGGYINLVQGTGYNLATSGTTDVELLVTETKNYETTWESLESAVVKAGDKVMLVSPEMAKSTRRDRTESKAQAQAAQAKTEKTQSRGRPRKNKAQPNANSSSVVGVNPRPGGPGAYSD